MLEGLGGGGGGGGGGVTVECRHTIEKHSLHGAALCQVFLVFFTAILQGLRGKGGTR